MESDSSFGAGIFDESSSRPSQDAPPANEEDGNGGSPEYVIQQEREEEKALLLRRSRETTGKEAKERSPRKPANGNRRRASQGNRNRSFPDPSQPDTFAQDPEAYRGGSSRRETTATPERRPVAERRPAPANRNPEQLPGPVLLDQRVAILVDVQNMYHSARKIHGRNLSYSKLLNQTVRGRKLIRAIAYLLDREGVDQGAFLDHLANCGFELRRKDLIERADGSRKGDWDLGIAADAMAIANKVDVLIIVSGDGDFVSLADLLKHQGVKVEIASFRESTADALFHSADFFHSLGQDTLYGNGGVH